MDQEASAPGADPPERESLDTDPPADGGSFVGPTHWHVFDIVARRPA